MPTRTFLFVDQVGSTAQLTSLGDRATHDIRQSLFDLLRQATSVSGGHEVDFTGDGLFCAFEGAAEAVDAAVLMQQLASSFNDRQLVERRIGLRIGLNSGEPLTSAGGGYFGAAVVIASRLCSRAETGQILATEIVRSLVEPRGSDTFRSVGALTLRGVPGSIGTFEIGWKPDRRASTLPERLAALRPETFVGRRPELNRIGSAWDAAKAGTRQLVLVSGDRGVGVSSVLAEAAERLRQDGAAVWFGQGAGDAERLAPWSEAIAHWAAASSRAELRLAMGSKGPDLLRLVPSLATLVPGLPNPPPVNPASELFLIADAVDQLCSRWSQHQAIVVVLDDLESADPASWTIIRRLTDRAQPGSVLVLGGYEPSSVGTSRLLATLGDVPGVVDLRLDGLDATDVETLITALTHEEVTPASLRAVLAETEGSPYFVVQMAASLRDRSLTRQVQDAVGRAEETRTDLRLRREEIALGLRQLEQLRNRTEVGEAERIDPDGTPPAPGASPYKGLVAFRPDDAEDFFGREMLAAELVARLVSSRFLAVVGPSGSGKSSVLNAGVLPALSAGAVPNSHSWVPVVCTPATTTLTGAVVEARAGAGGAPLVLVVDQFEELWTQQSAEDRQRELDVVVDTATDPRSADVVIVAMRADYYGRAAEDLRLADLMAESHVLVGPMTAAELRTAIESPARRAGLVLESGLAQAVIDDLADQPGNLPLLSTALQQTWERRRGRSLTLTAYAETGGARQALAQLADSTYNALSAEQQTRAEQVMLRLVSPEADGAEVARAAALTEFEPDEVTTAVLTHLGDRRLITIGRRTVQLAHEALLREWPRLQKWLSADREGRRFQQELAAAAMGWELSGRDDGALLRGARLAAAADWQPAHATRLTAAESEFLAASLGARQRELTRARRTARRFQLLAAGLVVLLVSAIIASGFAFVQRREAVAQRQEATSRANEADARGLAAQAIALSSTKVDTALLLAIEGYRRDDSIDTRSGLLSALNGARFLTEYHPTLPRDASDIALSPDRKTLVVITTEGKLRRFDTASWREVGAPLVEGIKTPGTLAVSRDGKRAAYGAAEGVQTVDLASGRPVGPARGGAVGFAQDFSRDGSVLVTSTEAMPGARAFKLSSGRMLGEVVTAPNPASVDVSPRADEMVVAPGEEPTLRRYRFDGNPAGPRASMKLGPARILTYSPNGRRIVVVHDAGVTEVVDATTLLPVGNTFRSRAGNRVVDVSFTPSGRLVAASTDDGSVAVAEVETGNVVANFTGLAGAVAAEFLDEHRLLALTTSEAAEFDLRRPTAIGTAAPQVGPVLTLVRSADGNSMYAGELGRSGRVDAQVKAERWTQAPSPATDWPIVSSDGRLVAWHEPASKVTGVGRVLLAEADSGTVRAKVPIPGDTTGGYFGARLAFSPDASRLAVGTDRGRLTIIDVASGKVVVGDRQIDFTVLPALSWSADGTHLYAGGQDGLLKSVDPVAGTLRWAVPLSPGIALTDIESVPETTLLAAASESGFVYFVNTESRKQDGEALSAAGTALQALAVSPSGRRVAALGGDGALRLWERSTGRAVGPPVAAHTDWSLALEFLNDSQVMTGSFDGMLISWNLEPDRWVDLACETAGRDLTETEWQQYLPERSYRRTCTDR